MREGAGAPEAQVALCMPGGVTKTLGAGRREPVQGRQPAGMWPAAALPCMASAQIYKYAVWGPDMACPVVALNSRGVRELPGMAA